MIYKPDKSFYKWLLAGFLFIALIVGCIFLRQVNPPIIQQIDDLQSQIDKLQNRIDNIEIILGE